MKKALITLFALTIVFLGVIAAEAGGLTKFHLAKVYGFDKSEDMQVMTDEQYKQIDKKIKDEARAYSKAVALASKEWKANEDHKGKSFPRGAAVKRKIKVMQTFRTMDEANKKLDTYKSRARRSAEKEAEKKKKRGGSAKDKEKAMKDAQKKATRDSLYAEARALFEAKLGEIVGGGAKKEEAKKAK